MQEIIKTMCGFYSECGSYTTTRGMLYVTTCWYNDKYYTQWTVCHECTLDETKQQFSSVQFINNIQTPAIYIKHQQPQQFYIL